MIVVTWMEIYCIIIQTLYIAQYSHKPCLHECTYQIYLRSKGVIQTIESKIVVLYYGLQLFGL